MKKFTQKLITKINNNFKIGFTDSGLGSLIFAIDFAEASKSRIKELSHRFNCEFELIQLGDNANVPYSTKTPQKVNQLINTSLHQLEKQGCKIGVVACNTACVDDAKFPFLTKLKPFTIVDESAKIIHRQTLLLNQNSKSSSPIKMLIMATEATIKSQDYHHKISTLHEQSSSEKKLEIYGFSAPELVIKMETEYLDQTKISLLASKTIEKMFNEIGEKNLQEISNIALFCTHYPLFKKEISKQLQEKFGKKFHLFSQGEILSDKILDEAEKVLNSEKQTSVQENKAQNDLESIDSSSLQPKPQKSEIKISSSFTDTKSQEILEHNIKLVYPENCALIFTKELSRLR